MKAVVLTKAAEVKARLSKPVNLTQAFYELFMMVLYALFYATSPQGRMAGFVDMKFAQGQELLNRSFAKTTALKNSTSMSYQAVIASPEAIELLRLFLAKVRPVAVKNRVLPHSRVDLPTDPLFVGWDGTACGKVGRYVSKFFVEFMRIKITTTTIRSLNESAAVDKLFRGEITAAARDAVARISGHSSATGLDYYVQRSTEADVAEAFEGHNGLTPGSVLLPRTVNKHLVYGTEHEDKDKVKRARFSSAELLYMQNLIMTLDQTRSDFVARCLHHIQNDPEARPIFHERHVFHSGRLRGGFFSNFVYDEHAKAYEPTFKRACIVKQIEAYLAEKYNDEYDAYDNEDAYDGGYYSD